MHNTFLTAAIGLTIAMLCLVAAASPVVLCRAAHGQAAKARAATATNQPEKSSRSVLWGTGVGRSTRAK